MTKNTNSNTTDKNAPYLVVLNSDKSDVIAFVNVTKGYDLGDVCEALSGKGINAEVRVPQPDTEKKAVL